MIDAPPLLAGAVHEIVTEPLPGVPTTSVGDPGIVGGVTAADAVDADPVPAELLAVTVNVYGVPFVSPLIVQLVAGVAGDTDVTEHVAALLAVAVYRVIV